MVALGISVLDRPRVQLSAWNSAPPPPSIISAPPKPIART